MNRILIIALVLAAAIAAPFFIYPVTLMTILCFIIFACSFNLLLGYTGLLCFGHAMFFGGAAYVTGYILKSTGLSVELAILAGGASAGLLGLFIGYLTKERLGIQFAMITLAFSQLIFFFFLRAPFTGGDDGMQSIPRNALFGFIDVSSNFTYYYVVLAISALAVLIYYRIVHSPYGEVLKAVRDNEARVESLGFHPEKVKLMAFVLSATMAGVAGATKATVFQFATLTDVSWAVSGEVILMTLLGGLGTLTGPAFGAAIIIWLNEHLAGFGEWALITQGVILLLVIIFF
ncbi:MAG: branched-chain amino acid ABC transporter permease, partial [Mesorhizobium sp.]